MEDNNSRRPHTLFLENRNKLTLSGVTDVGKFNEETMQVQTEHGELTVCGENLQVASLSLESGDVTVSGRIISLSYTEPLRKSGGLFSRIFN